MVEIGATEFKAKCLALMDRVAARRETILVTKRGRPVAKLVPVEREPRPSILGCMQEKVEFRGDIVSPILPPGAWNALDEWDHLARTAPKRQPPKASPSRRKR